MSTPPLLEREAELGELARLLDDLAAGRGSVVLLEGPAGIGKTALLDAARGRAAEQDVLVLGARASELDREFAHGVAHQLLGPPLAAADDATHARLLSGAAAAAAFLAPGGASAPVEPFAVLHGLHWLVLNLAEARPVLLLVDDLHWADAASLRFLEHLGRRLDGTAVAVLATSRPDEPGAAQEILDELAAGPAARTLRPGALRDDAVGAVLEAALGAAPEPAFAAAAARATGGNPLLATILAREAASEGLHGLATEDGSLEALGGRGVAPAVRRRLRTLGPAAEQLARAAAVAGPRAAPADLAALAGLTPADAIETHAHLVRTEVLAADGRGFVHPLVRAAVLDACPPAERARLHGEAARRLRAQGARPQEIAVHRRAAPPAGDEEAVEDLRAAAAVAVAEGAADTAVDLLTRALGEPPSPVTRAPVTLALAELEVRTGRPEGPPRLRALLDEDGLDADLATRAHAALGNHLVHTDPERALAELETALVGADDPRLALQLEAHTLEALIYAGGAGDRLAARLARGAADPDASPAMLSHLAVEAGCRGEDATVTAGLARRAFADGRLVGDVGPASSTWNLAIHALRFAELPEEARRALVEGERVAQERGSREATLFVEHAWGYWHRDFGSVATGAARAGLGLQVIRELGMALTVPALSAITAENLAHCDRLDEAVAHIDVPLTDTEGTYVEPFALSARALVRALARRTEEAEQDLRRLIALGDARGWAAPHAVHGRLRLATLLARTGRAEEALALSDEDLAAARRVGLPGATGMVLRVRALALPAEEAIEVLRTAVDALGQTAMRLELGWALHDLGARLRVRGDRRDAREPLRRALDLAARTDSTRLGRHVRAELESTGARPQRDRVDGVAGLTPAERRVADLAADGLTNREIAQTLWVTPKTVEMHLGRIYGKLGIRGRGALSEALHPEGVAAP